jgi:FkbM family methyltransferase
MGTHTKGVKSMIFELQETGIKFDIRDEYNTDMIVVKEMFEENVYEIHGWHFDDKDAVVVDIGANIGAFAIQAASLGARKVFAIEPEPHNFSALENNIKLNNLGPKIFPCKIGVSDFVGQAVISDEGGGATIKDNKNGSEIEVTTLDLFFETNNINKVSVLKIDVEGSEVEIILGSSIKSLSKCEYISIEFDIRTGKKLGELVMKLSETHHVRTMGSWERGGMIFANRY